jgi:CheY-like chemotaxis protein
MRNRAELSEQAADRAMRDKLMVEEPSMVAFFGALRHGLEPSEDNSPEGIALSQNEFGPPESEEEQARRLQEFFDSAPYQVSIIRTQFSKISLASDKERAKLFRVFLGEIEVLKQKAGMSPLRPIWLMTCALEGLIHQLAGTTNANASVLRTIAGAVDLLEDLCVRGFDPTLATRTPVELLAVDDNAVCLAAVSLALKKAFRQPDLASEGLSALASAEKRHYDVIFLDVEMPGLNGFDLCTEIRKTELNCTTPVVFVTGHSDFDSRAKSALVGGQELIAKPYLSFEITVKALTLALHGRLVADTAAQSAAKEEAQDCVVA